MLPLQGKSAVVTGGGSGIGRAVVKRLAERGASVAVLDISTDAAAESVAIAEQAGVSYPTVRSRLDKVIESLRQEVARTPEGRGPILDGDGSEKSLADEAAQIIKAV